MCSTPEAPKRFMAIHSSAILKASKIAHEEWQPIKVYKYYWFRMRLHLVRERERRRTSKSVKNSLDRLSKENVVVCSARMVRNRRFTYSRYWNGTSLRRNKTNNTINQTGLWPFQITRKWNKLKTLWITLERKSKNIHYWKFSLLAGIGLATYSVSFDQVSMSAGLFLVCQSS